MGSDIFENATSVEDTRWVVSRCQPNGMKIVVPSFCSATPNASKLDGGANAR
ncbi:hypothetical protein PILCRDRAFT_822289 [Piloderma croceum F 1598]|uniref:Uncharacterized protein n=1 Tax=Piloderma croceum (strain F 1598) TaxID=765440 RepID=A0A0C3FKP7_PILCF|nr:hypothetical protein PILCRDRAFT_822289 [Piloderma croceum F 1598]